MNKWKRFLFPLIALVMLAFFAVLPKTVAWLQDEVGHSEVKYGEMETLHLSLDGENPLPSVSMMGKLNMLRNEALYSISESQASMTKEEVLAAIDRELLSYYKNGLMFNEWENAEKFLMPYLSYDREQGYCIFWEVNFFSYANDYYLNLYVEDETGKIVFITYQADSLELSAEEQRLMLEALTNIYFGALGIVPAEAICQIEDILLSVAANTTAVSYTFYDDIYGEVSIEFYMHKHGFYNIFPT